MTAISLRNYIREIGFLIDQGKFPEAVKHCKHILKHHPKNVDTYRLMGKAFLENQQYSEAADIFQRIISVIPDDTVSQTGLSIIHEDEGNLDAAIWHLERAYEVNPANTAMQNEIRRLYGRRDGIQPSKIRLTRGALVRMYLQGERYSQALSEARAALSDDPQRIDLEVLLARVYYLTGNKIAAAEACSQIISKAPYCLESNKILSIILSSMDRKEEAKLFQERIYSLDPYTAHISKNAPSVQQVPDNAVMLEKLVLDFEEPDISQQPDWAQTIGVKMESSTENSLPDWLNALKNDRVTAEKAEEDITAIENLFAEESEFEDLEFEEGEDIPGWMKTAGWQQAAKTEIENETAPDLEYPEDQESLPVEQAEIPDWLKDLTPVEEISEEEISEKISRTPNPQEVFPEDEVWEEPENQTETGSYKTTADETDKNGSDHFDSPKQSTKEPLHEIDEAVDWLESLKNHASAQQEEFLISEASETDSRDEWVKEYQETEESVDEPQPGTLAQLDSSDDTEDLANEETMQSGSSFTKEKTSLDAASENTEGLAYQDPDQFSGPLTEETGSPDAALEDSEDLVSEEPMQSGGPSTEETASTDAASEVIEDLANEEPMQSGSLLTKETVPPDDTSLENAAQKDNQDFEDAFAWLESLAVKQGADADTLSTDPETRNDEIPEWLNLLEAESENLPDTEEDLLFESTEEIAQEKPADPESGEQPEYSSVLTAETPDETTEEEPALPEIGDQPDQEMVLPSENTEERAEEALALPEISPDLPQENSEQVGQVLPKDEYASGSAQEAEGKIVEYAIPDSSETADEPGETPSQTGTPDETHPEESGTPPEPDPLSSKEVIKATRQDLQAGEVDAALEQLEAFIQANDDVSEVILVLEESLKTHPVDARIWHSLGNAYTHNNQIQKALEAYSKAEELLF